MDPLSAFGLAVNVLSVVDISKSFLETLGQVKDAGSSAATRDIVSISRSLQASNAKIASQSWAENDDEAFKNLVEECQKLSKELVRLAEELSVRSSSKLVAKLKVAALTVWSHSRIEEKKARLETIRGQILFDIVVPMARRVHEIPDKAAIDTQTQSLLKEIKAGQDASSAMEKRLRIFHEEYAAVQDERHTELVSLLRDVPDVRPQPPMSTKRDENLKSKGLVLDSLLDSFYFPQESDRFHNINPAHKGTFEWIYRQPPTGANKATWTNFREWMQHGSGIYWISGKAGSGKSTLMKLLRTDARTRSCLRDWGASSRLLVLSFYFWNPGTPLQKSLEGLLRSVIVQALEECPELVEKIFDAGLLRRIDKYHSPTIPELKQAFSCLTAPGLTDSSGAPISIVLLIDGLDEFDAGTTSFTELAALFTAAAQSPSFKAVLSSRPENAFEDAFINCSKLRLHYLTHSDVVKYVNENLTNHPRMFQLISRAPEESANLVEEIVEAAQGVFLWVKVVVRSLLEGFQNHDDIGALTERLRELPTDLEDLFRVMLERVPHRYKSTMSKIFQLIRGTSELQSKDQPCMDGTVKWPLTALSLKFALVEPKAVLQAQIGEFTLKGAFEEIRSIEAQMRICCSGLIELRASAEQVHPDLLMEPAPEAKNEFSSAVTDSWNDWYDPEMQFIHRSVKEYLSKEDVWDAILALDNFNVEAALLQSLVMQAKCGSYRSRKSSSSKGVPWDIVATALEITRTLEIECGTDQLDMMNALETALTTRCRLSWWDTFDDFPTEGAACHDSLFAFAVRYGLRLYVRARLRNGGCQSLHKQGRPLLTYACAPTAAPVWVRGLDVRIVADLLQHGANPNKQFNGCSPWQHAWYAARSVLSARDELFPILETLLAHGADPNAYIEYFEPFPERPLLLQVCRFSVLLVALKLRAKIWESRNSSTATNEAIINRIIKGLKKKGARVRKWREVGDTFIRESPGSWEIRGRVPTRAQCGLM